jgi:uncharacterized protein YjbI with pentapeptide repeats
VNLGFANLQGANLSRADLQDAVFVGANLHDAFLRGANLQGANLGFALADETTRWPDGWTPDRANARGVEYLY